MTSGGRYDVIIAGYGPVGQVAANLLGQRGFRVAAFDVSTSVYHLPRAAHFDAEIMRVFQSAGLAEAVLPACAQVRGMHFLNAAGEKLLAFNAPERLTQHGWPAGYLFYQPDLERAIRAGAERFPNVDVFGGHEVLSIEQVPDTVAVRVRELATNEERTVEGDWLWGCDGARSLTRKTLGIELDDFEFDQPWLVVDTMLKRDVDLPEVALQICDPARPTTFIPSTGKHRRWEFMLLPGETPEEMERDETVWRLLGPWITCDDTEVIRAVVYSFHALIAKSYRHGRVLILGDAAHQMPPFLGQGMCAGIRDAANLAWKLDLIQRGLAGESLLDTYYEERAPHVRAIITRAVTAGRIIQTTDCVVAEKRDRMFLAAEKRDLIIGGEAGGLQTRMPALASGFFDPETASRETVGQHFPQPLGILDEQGLRLDDLYSGRFAIIAGTDAAQLFTPEVRAAWRFLNTQFVQVGDCTPSLAPWPAVRETNGKLTIWLAENGAAVVRPDLYVYGVARSAAELLRLAKALREQLGGPRR
jgi:3-(3-hydroxy-phenyl)propionate hydroxylase